MAKKEENYKLPSQIIREAKITIVKGKGGEPDIEVLRLNSGELDYGKEYIPVKNALHPAGGKWDTNKNGFTFPGPIAERIKEVLEHEDAGIPLKKKMQIFYTPDGVSSLMVEEIEVTKGMKVGEPHGGQGHLIKAVLRRYPFLKTIYTYEPVKMNTEDLGKIKQVTWLGKDFLEAAAEEFGTYDVFFANPPFHANEDITHVEQMYKLLKPGGWLVSVMSISWMLGSQKKQVKFRDWLDMLGAKIVELPEGSFKETGTNIRAVYIVLQKPHKEEVIREVTNLLPLF